MKRKQFTILINASREKVWQTLWGDDSYGQWTAPFSEDAKAVTDWKEGSQVLFLSPDGDGMVSEIARKDEPGFMSFRHLGMAKGGKLAPMSREVLAWSGAMENYTLQDLGGQTEVTVDMDIVESYEDYFTKTWPLALDKLKEISEQ